MKYSYKLSDAVHLLSYLEICKNGDLSSRTIAASIESNPSIVRQLMSDLRQANLIATQKGKATPRLTRSPKDINLYDIYQAINMDHHLLHVDPKTNPKCIVGSHIQETLDSYYKRVEEQAYKEMKEITLEDVIQDILNKQKDKQ